MEQQLLRRKLPSGPNFITRHNHCFFHYYFLSTMTINMFQKISHQWKAIQRILHRWCYNCGTGKAFVDSLFWISHHSNTWDACSSACQNRKSLGRIYTTNCPVFLEHKQGVFPCGARAHTRHSSVHPSCFCTVRPWRGCEHWTEPVHLSGPS